MEEVIAFRTDARQAWRLAGLCAAGAIACIAALAASTEESPGWAVWAGWTALVGLSIVGLIQLARALDRRPVITLDAWGVADRRMRVAAPWEKITGAGLWGGRWLALEVAEPEAAHETRIGQVKLLHRLADAVGAPSVLLDLNGLEAKGAEVLAALRRRKPDLANP